jgi:hypothetical protein
MIGKVFSNLLTETFISPYPSQAQGRQRLGGGGRSECVRGLDGVERTVISGARFVQWPRER